MEPTAINEGESSDLPPLILKPGEIKTLEARRHEYSRVEIPSGSGVITVPGSFDLLQIVVKGDMVLHGAIANRQNSSDERDYTLTFPNGETMQMKQRNRNRGGDGGDGGPAEGGRGGRGSFGTTESGGGGGGGGSATFQTHQGWIRPTNGEDGSGRRGGRGGAPAGGSAGDGAVRARHINGGFVYILVEGDFDGTGGMISVPGEVGTTGEAAPPNTIPHGAKGAGGGGGGGPGGQGGVVAIYVKGDVVQWPSVYSQGGPGGAGGRPNGGQGETGDSGYYEFRTPRDATRGQSDELKGSAAGNMENFPLP